MSLILMSILFFLTECVFQTVFPKNKHKLITKKLYAKLKKFTFIADVLLLIALSFKFFLSRIEPLLIYIFVNVDELTSVEGIKAVLSTVESYVIIDPVPVDVSFVLVVFLTYFGAVMTPGVLCASILIVTTLQASLHRETGLSEPIRRSEIHSGEKLFLKLGRLLN